MVGVNRGRKTEALLFSSKKEREKKINLYEDLCEENFSRSEIV